jgi:hypothetical protein
MAKINVFERAAFYELAVRVYLLVRIYHTIA